LNDIDNQEIFLLAVYGTLKENFPNYYYYLNPKKPLFSGLVKIPYQMYSNGGFPLLYPSDKDHQIYVEIFEVNQKTLEKIDRLEGVPDFYSRKTLFLDEVKSEVFIYVFENGDPKGELLEEGFFS